MVVLYDYFASGIVDSGIRQFGGDECYAEIPSFYHWTVSIVSGTLSVFLCWLWRNFLAAKNSKRKHLKTNWLEWTCFLVGLASLMLTLHSKLATKRGLFILNPCHVALAMLLVLLIGDNSSLAMRRLHSAWTAWLFCPFSALVLPHLEEISIFQVLLYYIEHLVILPIGPFVLLRRYGNPWPTIKSHLAGFGTIVAFQMFVLVPFGRFLKVNLNFALCHSPDQPFYPNFGYHYFLLEIFNLCIIAYFVHLATSITVSGLSWIRNKLLEGEAAKKE